VLIDMQARRFCLVLALGTWGCLQEHQLFRDVEAGAGASSAPAKHGLGEACARDEDCVAASWCAEGTCSACPAATRCRDNFSAIKRNDCTWCAPPNECLADAECGDDGVCHAGLQCLPGCHDDPSCCFGNLCGDASCGRPTNLDCAQVGCPDGGSCVGTGRVDDCECEDPALGWSCATVTGANQCQLEQ
jgi:hypothetical protein